MSWGVLLNSAGKHASAGCPKVTGHIQEGGGGTSKECQTAYVRNVEQVLPFVRSTILLRYE